MSARGVMRWAAVVVAVLAGCREAPAPSGQPTARASAALSSWPTAGQWVSLKRAATAIGDPTGDAAGAPGTMKDLVGTEVSPAAFVWSNATQVYFRMRLGASPISGADLAASQWGCLLDTDGRANTWEYAVMVNGQGADQVEFWKKTTTATLDSTSEAADSLLKTYSGLTDGTGVAHAQVTAAGTSLGGGADQFLDFAVDQADLQAAGVTVANAVRVLCGSSATIAALDDDRLGTGQSLSGQLSDAVALGIDGTAAWVQLCPAGLACYFMPPMLPAPTSAADGYAVLGGGDMVFASPTGASTVTYKFGGSATTNTLSVASGGKQLVQLTGGSSGFASALKVAESRGVYATSTRHDLLAEQRYTPSYWQSSSTIKADTVALGTRFRVAGYSLNNGTDGSGWDYLAFYAPWATTITVTAPASAPVDIWNTASRTVTVSLTAGQTYILNSKAGSAYPTRAPDIDGTLVTSTAPISLVVGGMGWGYTPAGAGCAGDTGSDGVVPVKYLGTEYVVSKFSATGEEDVRVVADTDGTVVSVDGAAVATLAAGATYKFVPTGVHYITASAPVAVFENTAYINCEADIGFIPPIAFASQTNVPSMTVAFNAKGPGTVFVVVPSAQKSTVRLDGAATGTETAVPGRADLTTLKFSAAAGDHSVTASSDIQVMLVAQDPGGGTGYVGYYSPYRRPGVGNGVLDAGEACDDANVSDGDGCSSVGEVEAGWACVQNVSGVSVCGCATDSSCPTGQYCANGTPNVCTAKVTAGTAIPADHGTCGGSGSLGSAATACSTGLCNATSNTCASGAGVACTTASQCAGNTCTSNVCVDTVVLTVTPGTTSYIGGGAAMPVDPSLTVTGTYAVTGASVSITSGFVSAQDRLNYTTIGSITGSYDTTRGTLTMSGTGTLAQWQTALRSVTYSNVSATPTSGNRTVSISLGTALSNPANGHFYEYVSSAGSWTSAKSAALLRSYMGLKGYLATITSAAENSFITGKLTSDGWIGAQATPETSYPRNWQWTGGPEAGQAFCSNNSSGSWAVLNSLYANWAGGEPNNSGGEGCGQIYFAQGGTWNDLPCTYSLAGYVVEYGGSAGDPVLAISGTRTVAVSYVATSLTATGTTLGYDQGSGAVTVDGALTAAGTTTYSSATVAITAGYVSAEDTLAMPTTNGISATFSAGTLTLSGVGTTADYQAAFRAVTYTNSVTPRPTTAARNVRFTLGSATANRALQVKALPTVTVSSSNASAPVGNAVTLTATLNPPASTGSVQFFADGTSLGTVALSSGVASISTSALALGTHTITAAYGGDTQRLAATSAGFTQTIVTLTAGQGPCTAGTSATVCSAGLTCNTTTSTCGAPSGGACTAANQCANNICALNGLCGTQNGGACTTATASSCQSGACSANANTCIPVGGCAVTADCGAGEQCNTGTLQCEVAPGITASAGTTVYDATGADVIVDPNVAVVGTNAITGATVTLGTGFVAAQDQLVYVTGNGITGAYNATTGILTLSGSASSAAYQAALRTVAYRNTAGALPSTALRNVTFAIGSAVANGTNGHFYEYVSFSGTWTQAKNNAVTRSYLGLQGYLATLTSAAENDFVRTKLTNDGWIGAQANPENSYPRTWYWVTGPEAGTGFCTNASSGSCVSISGGYSNWASGEPNNAGGEGCGQIYFVNSGKWNDLPCNSGTLAGYVVEYGGSTSDPVLTLSSSKALQVRAKTSIAVSSSTASAALHASVTLTATFSPAAATGTAQFLIDGVAFGAPVSISSGVASLPTAGLGLGAHTVSVSYAGDVRHQAATGALAGTITINPLANGAGPCDASNAATDCQSGVCSAAGTCGYGTNEGPCTAATAALCQSGTCSVGGACMPSGGCYVDGDCGPASYCNRATNQCVAKLPAGTGIPSDGLHDGTCQGGTSSTCASGTCNQATNTCATTPGTACTSAAQCTTNACAPSGVCVPATPSACWADSDCPATDYCDRAAFTCTVKLPSGAPIPSDGLHTGVCTDIAAAPTCVTGLCNATTNTCASAVGASCTAAAECQHGTCAANGTCGIANGGSGCTAATAYLCQSGACAASGACVPPGPGSCFLDSDCPAADYCDRAHYACVSKEVAGAALPNDGALHLGVCTPALAAAVCASGTCNATTDTCAAANGASCTAAAQCVVNVCGGDGSCGHPDGEGPCDGTSAATICRSGFCNASGSACVPSATGCFVDADCAASEYCARASFTCTAKQAPGTPLPADGLHASCAGPNAACVTGLCNATTATCAQGNAQPCTTAAECVSNACGANGQCGLANGQAGCSAQDGATLCQSGSCTPSGVCAPSTSGCYLDSDCQAGQFCDRASLTCQVQLLAGADIPSDGLHLGVCDTTGVAVCASGACNAVTNTCAAPNGTSCTAATECVTNVCGGDGSCGHPAGEGPCTASTAATACRSGFCNGSANGNTSACVPTASGCWVDDDCAATEYCARATFTCTAKEAPGTPLPADGLHASCVAGVNAACATGLCNETTTTCAQDNSQPCTAAAQCVSNACGSNGQCGLANGDSTCTAQNGATLCQSGSCTPSGVCAPGGGCYVDSECATGQYCDRTSLTCHGQLLAGTAIPDDGLHLGVCDATGAAVCASGQCNATTDTCAADKNVACATDAQCVSNQCGTNGKCGLADGQAGCSQADAAPCQSGTCSSAGVCVPAQSGSCWVDADCAAELNCHRDQMVCIADGLAGDALVVDTLHDGICSPATAQAVCVTAACNPAENTCAAVNGTSCTAAAQCVTDVCGANGKCGFADGQAGCTASTAARCQSQTCSTSGTCMPAAGCWVDEDCAQGQWCDRAATTCRSQLVAGTVLPSDGLHDGLCTEANATVLCQSGVCNAETNTCGATNSEGCSQPSDCESNICGPDGRCGAVDGAECTSDSQCRNGCVEGRCANSDPGVLTGGAGCSTTGSGAGVAWLLALVLLVAARRSRRVAASAVVALALVAVPARAQSSSSTASPGAAVDTFRSAAPGSEWFSTDSLDFRGTVRPSARFLIDWGHALLVVRNSDGTLRGTPVENQLWFNLGAGVTLFDRVRVFANVPVAVAQSGSASTYGGQPLVAGSAGFGDLGFGADVRLFGSYGAPFTLAVGATLTAPTGSSASMLGDGVASVMPRVLAAGQVGMVAWAAQLGFNFRGAGIGSINFGNEVRFAASAGVKLLDQKLLVGPELFAVAPVTSSGTSRTFGLEGDLGAHYAITPSWRIGAGVGTGLVNAAGVPDVRALASVDWQLGVAPPAPPDADGDGVPDASDACPRERGVSAQAGCAAPPDDDRDGVANADDLCPQDSAARTPDPKRRGCALPPDGDGDGVPDAEDLCPSLAPAGPMNPKRPGCADRDADGDGVLESRDECPALAAGPRPDPARAGCPVPDADGDTVPDAVDRCPNEKGPPAMEGEKNGCPGLVRLDDDKLLTNSPVYFQTGTATLLPKSFPVLEAVKSALEAMPSAERVAVEGHTDATGKVASNQALSEARAQAVMKWLVDHGVAAGRLEAHGYGMTRLLIPDEKTEADRQTNRRVEFHILQTR